MKSFFFLFLFLASPSFAALRGFTGQYEVLSGRDNSYDCTDYVITLDDGPTIRILDAHSSYIVDEFPSINKGPVTWRSSFGDGEKKGKQVNAFDGKFKLTHEVRKFLNTFLIKRIELVLNGDQLTLTRLSSDTQKTCILKKL